MSASPLESMPNSLSAEQAVLGGLMLDNCRWDEVADRIVADDFYTNAHREIFSEMERLLSHGKPIDLITLAEALEQNGKLERAGGFAYLAEMSKNTPSAANICAYADIVRERAVVREMISVANEIAEAGYAQDGRGSNELLDMAERRVFEIAEKRQKSGSGPKDIASILDATVSRIEELFQRPHDGVTGLDTGFTDLNKKTAGLQSSDLIIVAARPSMGKTTFAMNLVENAAVRNDKPVLVFSLEMPSHQLMMRSLASLARVDQTRIRTGQLNNRTLEIAEISRSLKALAKELQVPVVALSQLNRSLEQRADKRPVNSDLRESGAIEQDADLIMFLYRDEVYHPDSEMKGIAEVIIGKQRNGPIGTVRLAFNGQYSRFDNYAGADWQEDY
ncbi:TPA: replicative DNA helicase [Escherichia coli]|nr:replicative DNA helicase [Escherichia coli]